VPGAEVTGGTAGTPFVLASGTMSFDSNGKLSSPSGDVTIAVPGWTNGAAAQSVVWQLFDTAGASLVTGYDGQSSTSAVNQNGYSAGTLRTLTVDVDGLLDGVFTNG